MGVWESERGFVSDDVADILGDALEKLGKCWHGAGLERFTMIDLADAIEFVTKGILRVEINPEAESLRKLPIGSLDPKIPRNKRTDVDYINKKNEIHENRTDVKTFENRGQIKHQKDDKK